MFHRTKHLYIIGTSFATVQIEECESLPLASSSSTLSSPPSKQQSASERNQFGPYVSPRLLSISMMNKIPAQDVKVSQRSNCESVPGRIRTNLEHQSCPNGTGRIDGRDYPKSAKSPPSHQKTSPSPASQDMESSNPDPEGFKLRQMRPYVRCQHRSSYQLLP
ncbi:uncharacterized protein LOC129762707 [Toxorhynchites rutilus septentrionalis]|uniref:uncharacterized protein LOC129762707 n=1 Tax=Toxorhynchites rutilus septentrionalis TaxID=329112 RepID=UPI002478E0A9|nr:uncharacterized protein LOC129762707 [Toxorhynchites rutilus septentrionalis]